MESLTNELQALLGGDRISQMSSAIDADNNSTQVAVQAAIPVLLGALARNASSQDGAGSLFSALTRDHDGSLLNDLSGVLRGSESSIGGGILGHVLGGKQPAVENQLGRASGLNAAQIGKILMMLAPIVMAYLGRQQRTRGLDSGGLSDVLQRERSYQNQAGLGPLTSILDQDGDGSIIDDIGGMLGGLLGGKK